MIRDLLLPIVDPAPDGAATDAAIALARACGAHLAAVYPLYLPMPVPFPWGGMPDVALGAALDEMRAQAGQTAARWRERFGRELDSAEVRVVEAVLEPPDVVALHARHADLAVMRAPAAQGREGALERELFGALLLESGRPVLVVPPGAPVRLPARRAVVAWQPRREAARALHDALALLQPAAEVHVVAVDPRAGEQGHGGLPGADIATHLARHGLQVEVIALPSAAQGVAATLLRHAAEAGADLLVAGGYGHSRLREWALGGVTRELLASAELPVLFSH